MPSRIEEMLAKKRAAAQQEVKPQEEVKPLEVKPDPQEVKREETAIAAPKVMSFAEKMALKKQQASSNVQPATQSVEKPAVSPVSAVTTIATVQQVSDSVEEKLRTGMLDHTLDKNPMPPPEKPAKEDAVDPVVAQAYADIKTKLDLLNQMSGTDLESAMKELKKALMQNPAAVDLMEDTDIGQLVIGLRRITGETIAEAAKEKKPGRQPRSKTVDLSNPDIVAQVFDEL